MKQNAKNIVLVNQDSGYLMVDLANYLNQNDYNVTLVLGDLKERDNKINQNIIVKKIIKYNKNNFIYRLGTWFISFLQIGFYIRLFHKNSHVVFFSNPPLTTLIPYFFNIKKYSFYIFDVFPNAFVDFGFIKRNSLFFKLWKKIQIKVFSKSQKIFTLTDGMRIALTEYVNEEKITIIPIWTDNKSLKPIPRNNNTFILNNNLENNFIILYSGNLGLANDLNVIIDAINIINNKYICLVIIGKGKRKVELMKYCESKSNLNYKFLDWQPFEMIPLSFASADLAIINLGNTASKLGIPSKLFNFLSVGSPILSITEKKNDLDNIITNYKIGKTFEKHEITEIENFITEISKNTELQNEFSYNSLSASKDFTIKNLEKFKL